MRFIEVRLAFLVFLSGCLILGVVSPVSAQSDDPAGGAGDGIVEFDPDSVGSPEPLADGVVHPDAVAAAEGGFDGLSVEVSGGPLDGGPVPAASRVDGVTEGGEMAPGRRFGRSLSILLGRHRGPHG